MFAFLQFCTFCWYNFLQKVDLDTLNKRAANYLRVLIFAILLSFAEIAEINTRENMVQWNPSITDIYGEQCFGPLYRGWPLLRGCFVHKQFIWDLGAWLLYSNWPLLEVVVNRGSTVYAS